MTCLSRSHYTDTDPTSKERATGAGIKPTTSLLGVVCSTVSATAPSPRHGGDCYVVVGGGCVVLVRFRLYDRLCDSRVKATLNNYSILSAVKWLVNVIGFCLRCQTAKTLNTPIVCTHSLVFILT